MSSGTGERVSWRGVAWVGFLGLGLGRQGKTGGMIRLIPVISLTCMLVHHSFRHSRGAIVDRRRLLTPRVHLRRARSGSGGSTTSSSTPVLRALLAWLGLYAFPLLFLLGLVLIGALMVRVIVLLSAPPSLGLVTGRPGGAGPAGVLFLRARRR